MNKSKDDPLTSAPHVSYCTCTLCQAMAHEQDITKEPSQQDQVRDWIEKTKKEIPPEPDYTPNSLVSKQKDRIKELVEAHWSFMEKVLSTGQDKQQTFTWDQMMEIRKWDYTSSAIHFYGHGYEDASQRFENKNLLKEMMKQPTKESK